MSKEIKNVEVEETDVVETTVKENKAKGFIAKVGNGLKKHGKKVAVVAVGAAIGFIGYAFGSKHKADNPCEFDCEISDSDVEEITDNNDLVE